MAKHRTARHGALACALLLAACQPAATPAASVTAGAAVPEPVPVNGVGYVVFNAPIFPPSRDMLIRDLDKLRNAGAREIDIAMNSPGGSVEAAQDIVDYMARTHAQDGTVFKAYNIGLVASAATYVFLNAQGRYTSPRGAFLFHAAYVTPNGPVTGEQLHTAADRLDAYERTIRTALVKHTHLTADQAQTYARRTVVLNADDAQRDGVVDSITSLQMPQGARAYGISYTPRPQPGAPASPATSTPAKPAAPVSGSQG